MGPTTVDAGALSRRRLARTVRCSTPREMPAYPSMTLRFGYFPSPKPSCRLPSLAAAMAQIFSVHDRSLVPTTAKVSLIWWHRPSSAGTSGPTGLFTGRRPASQAAPVGAVEHLLERGPVHDHVVGVVGHVDLPEQDLPARHSAHDDGVAQGGVHGEEVEITRRVPRVPLIGGGHVGQPH